MRSSIFITYITILCCVGICLCSCTDRTESTSPPIPEAPNTSPAVSLTPTGTETSDLKSGVYTYSEYNEQGKVSLECADLWEKGIIKDNIYTKKYEYNENGGVIRLTYSGYISREYRYEYDTEGKISAEYIDGVKRAEYTYSAAGCLINEKRFSITGMPMSEGVYTYDQNGNILEKKIYSVNDGVKTLSETDIFKYSSDGGVLEGINDFSGITYNSLGNVISYSNGREYTFSWDKNGRFPEKITVGDIQAEYVLGEYNLRKEKTVGDKRYEYIWDGGRLAAVIENGVKWEYTYTENGSPSSLNYNGTEYYFIHDAMGNVTGIMDKSGLLGEYVYDAWGSFDQIAVSDEVRHLVEGNVLRYKGYLYDAETGLYFIHKNIYDPASCRLLTLDGGVARENYIYCKNDPVSGKDPSALLPHPVCNDLYLYENGAEREGWINVKFTPTGENPVFQIRDSYKITDEKVHKAILEYIMASEFYKQDVYKRTMESMLVEWLAHNHIYSAYENERCRHVDFDRNDEGVTYMDFWKRAAKEYGNENARSNEM